MEEVKKQKTKTSKGKRYMEKHYEKNVLKSSNGITLIALVVTIIVLLILAGVSINIVLGKNGIFSKAQDSKYTMEKAVLRDKLETLIVNWKADNIVDNSVTVDRFWDDLEKAEIIDDKKTDVNEPISSTEPDGTKKDIYEIETTDGYIVDIIVTTKPDGEVNISIGDIELNTSTAPKIYIKNLQADETSITINVNVRRLNDGKITYLYREQGATNWTEIKKDTTNLTAEVTGLETGKTYEIKVYVKSSTGEDEKISNPIGVNVKVTTITLDKTSASIAEGTTMQLTATISPENATNKELEWKSSNESVATVDQNGKVTTLAEGTTTITVTAKDGSGIKEECNIIVEKLNPANYTWTQNKTEVTGTAKNGSGAIVKLEVGSAYTYDAGVSGGYTGSWGILGAGAEGTEEAGKLLIMTTSDVGTIELKGKDGYNNGISQLNALCVSKCGTGARSINVDDINRVTGYDPENQGDGTVMWAGNWYEYGNVVTYTANKTTSTKYTTPYTGGLYNSVYYHPDGRQIGGTGGTQVSSIQETSTEYWYYPYSLTTSNAVDGTCKGISTSSKAYEMIFGTYANASSGKGNQYWLASSCVYARSSYSCFDLSYVRSDGYVCNCSMWHSNSTSDFGTSMAVRSIVSL